MATLDYVDDEMDQARSHDQALGWDWTSWPSHLRRAVVTGIVVILGLAALIYLVSLADRDLTKSLKTQNTLKQSAQTKLQNVDQERKDIETHLPLLRQLEAAGIFGEEKRLEWVELLRNIEKRWPGVRIQYAISAQTLQNQAQATGTNPETAATLPSGAAAKSFGVFNTEMRLTLNLLHEGDALAIINELKTADLGRFSLRSCSFKRRNADNSSATTASTTGQPIESECTLTWISMKAYSPT
jgi:hypothetical protein